MNERFIFPANLEQLKGLADTFLLAVEAATESGVLCKTFRHNAAMAGLNLAHSTAIIAEEIAHQSEQQLIEKEIEKCRDSKLFYSEQALLF